MQRLVNIDAPVLFVPNLAIHLTCDSDRNKFEFNNELNLRPIIATLAAENLNKVSTISFIFWLYAEWNTWYLVKTDSDVLYLNIPAKSWIGFSVFFFTVRKFRKMLLRMNPASSRLLISESHLAIFQRFNETEAFLCDVRNYWISRFLESKRMLGWWCWMCDKGSSRGITKYNSWCDL